MMPTVSCDSCGKENMLTMNKTWCGGVSEEETTPKLANIGGHFHHLPFHGNGLSPKNETFPLKPLEYKEPGHKDKDLFSFFFVAEFVRAIVPYTIGSTVL